MSVRRVVYCDGPDCNSHVNAEFDRDAGFVRVYWDGTRQDFCSTDCALKWFAQFPPLTVIEA